MPQFFELDDSLNSVLLNVDGKTRSVALGSVVLVSDFFEVGAPKDYRVNIIGFTSPGVVSEADIPVRKQDIPAAYSVDNAGSVYRVEVYRENKFSGMVLVRFTPPSPPAVAARKQIAPVDTTGR